MLIDRFTLAAQAVNFVILVWLLKRFLYRPILDVMAAREKRVREALESARQEHAEAGRERAELERKNAVFEGEKVSLLAQAREAAALERQRLIEAARGEAETLRGKWHASLADEQVAFWRELASRSQEEVIAVARQALRDLAGADLEDRIAGVFIARLHALDGDARHLIADAGGTLTVRSASPLAVPVRERIEASLRDELGTARPVRFETNEGLVCGIELSLEGYKIAWTIRDYLYALEKKAHDNAA